MPRTARTAQPKTGRGAGRRPVIRAQREALGSITGPTESNSALPCSLDDLQITALIQFFGILDRWDREAHGPQVM
jgi:hypothetical protein